MDQNEEIIARTGLKRSYDQCYEDWRFFDVAYKLTGGLNIPIGTFASATSQPHIWWFALIASSLAFAFFIWSMIAAERYRNKIPAKARKLLFGDSGLQEFAQSPISLLLTRSESELIIDDQFKVVKRKNGFGLSNRQLTILHRPAREEDGTKVAEQFVLRLGGITTIVGTVIATSAHVSWKPNSSVLLQTRWSSLDRTQAISHAHLGISPDELNQIEMDAVCIGIASYSERLGAELEYPLSQKRAESLVAAMSSPAFIWHNHPSLRIFGLDLGFSKVTTGIGSDTEFNQRKAVIMVLSRQAVLDMELPFQTAVAEFISASEVGGVRLSDYSNASTPERYYTHLL